MKSELLYAKKYTSMDRFVCHLFYTERHSNRLTVINPSNFLGSLQTCPCGLVSANRKVAQYKEDYDDYEEEYDYF